MIITNPSLPTNPDSETVVPQQAWLRSLREKAIALIPDAVWIRVVLLAGLLVFGGVWFSLSLFDRLVGTGYLTDSRLGIISGPPVTVAVAFAFYVATLAVLLLNIFAPSFRQSFLRIETSPSNVLDHQNGSWSRFRTLLPLRLIDWVAVLGSSVGIMGLRFALDPFPQGADTPQYLQGANSILFRFDLDSLSQLHSVGVGRWVTVLAITGLRVILLPLPGQPELLTMMVVPVLLGIFYSISIFVFIHLLMGDRRLAVWGAIIAPISFLTIRLSYDLFAQFFGQALSVLALAGFLVFLLQGKGRARTSAAMYVVALLAHMWTWAVFAVISCIILGWAHLADSERRWEKLRRGLLVLAPSFVLLGLLTVALSSVQSDALYPYSVGDAHLFTLPEGWLWIGGWESAVVWALGIVGLRVLAARRFASVVRVPLLLWATTLSATVFVSGFRDSYRFLIMYPMPILVVIGMSQLSARLRVPLRRGHRSGAPALVVRGLPAAALVLVLLGSVLPWAVIPEWQYFPGDAAYRQLVEIRDQYGFGNRSLLILIDQRYFADALLWTSAVTGAQVYPGNLLSLLRGDSYWRDIHRWVRPDLSGVTEVLLPSTLYAPDSMEMGLLTSGVVPGVPYYRVAGGFNASAFLTAAALPLSNSFWTNWTLNTSGLGHTFSSANSRLNWTLPAQSSSAEFRSVSYVRALPNRTAESLYLLVSGSLTGAQGSIEVDFQSGNATSYAFDRILPDPLLIRIRLPAGEIPSQAKVTFWVSPGTESDDGWVQFAYMGLVSP